MIVSFLLIAIGLGIGVWGAYTRGLRFGGVVVLPLVAVYTLLNVVALPVFVLSTILAYLGLHVIQDRWVLYGRQLLLTAVLLGAVIPVGAFLVISALVGNGVAVAEITFLGSILPGIAAYNVYRQDPDLRSVDVLVTTATYLGLVVAGAAFLVAWARPPCWTCGLLGIEPAAYLTPILLQEGSDAVTILGLAARTSQAPLGAVPTVFTVIVLGLILGEGIRWRLGFRPLGVISLPVVGVLSLRAWWLLVVYVAVLGGTYATVQALHRLTYLYGRVILSTAIVVGTGSVLGVSAMLGLPHVLSLFFTGVLAGVGAYNLHVVAPGTRPATLTVSAGYFVVVTGIARALISPSPDGLATQVTVGHGLAAVLVVLVAGWTVYRYERVLPSPAAIRTASPFQWEGDDR